MKREGDRTRKEAIKAELAAMPARAEELRAFGELADFLGRWDRYDASGKLKEEETAQPPRTVGEFKAILDSFASEEAPERAKIIKAHLPEFVADRLSQSMKHVVALRAFLNTRSDTESVPQFAQAVEAERRELIRRQDELQSELYE